MDKKFDYNHLNFEQAAQHLPRRLMPIVVILLVFILGWFILPPGARFFPVLLLVVALSWTATYGWQSAIKDLIHFLQNLQTR